MEALGLTPEQAEIVAHRGSDMLVTAGAGSGKTRVLVERYLSLLGGHRIPEMAAVTFTDAAATEMRERVRREVHGRPELAHHRSDLDEAVIGTIHSLCLRILREHPVESALDPAIRVLNEDEAELELIKACHDALEEAAEADDHRALALREMGVFTMTNNLSQLVRQRDEVEKAYRAMPGASLEAWADHARTLMDAFRSEAIEEARPELAHLVSWLKEAHTGDSDALHNSLSDALEVLGDPNMGDWADLLERASAAAGRIKLNGGSPKNWGIDIKEVRDRMRRFRDIGKELGELPAWNEHDELALETVAALRGLLEDACARYEARKRELAALDYLDLEVKAITLLSSYPDIAASYRARFRHLMVDELQDVNPPQIELLRLLSGGDDGVPKGPERFLVGDVKQAIYRFRGSDVRHFTRLRHEIESTGAVRALSRSFRAHDPLVETLNVMFEDVFRDPRKEFEAPMQRMTGRGTVSPGSPHLVLQPVSDARPDGEKASGNERRRVEANAAAAEIKSLLDRKVVVWDKDTGQTRPAKPSDVAILLRRLSNVHLYEQALESHGVPYRTASSVGFFTRQEALDLTNLLGWLVEPDDDIALVGALRSPLFMVDDESLLALRSAGRDLLDALGDPPDTIPADVRSFCRRAAEVLADLRSYVPFAAPDSLLERALALTGFEAAWAPLQGGDQALGNIRKFVGLARTLEGHSLDEFVTYVRRRRDDMSAREGQAVLDDSDAVRLLTIHGAKGLEFPIVFVPEAHLSHRDMESYDPVRWRAEEGISLTMSRDIETGGSRRRPGFYAYLMERDREEEAAEHKRLFYVAATRAADMLYVSGDDSNREGSWLASAMSALAPNPPDGVEARPAIAVDIDAIARRPLPAMVEAPPDDQEEDFMPALVARPRVIPLRSSTPVTALQAPSTSRGHSGHGDGLGLIRGSLAHQAIQSWFNTGVRPDLAAMARRIQDGLDEQAVGRIAVDVEAMLDLLDASPLASTLRDQDTRAYFEMPFNWDWDGVPVHGAIDLVYQSEGSWRLIDFKTDDIRGRTLAEAAESYLPQLALYAAALERAIGQRPAASLLFLRTGDFYTPPDAALDQALADTRARIDEGQALETPPFADLEDEPVQMTGL